MNKTAKRNRVRKFNVFTCFKIIKVQKNISVSIILRKKYPYRTLIDLNQYNIYYLAFFFQKKMLSY